MELFHACPAYEDITGQDVDNLINQSNNELTFYFCSPTLNFTLNMHDWNSRNYFNMTFKFSWCWFDIHDHIWMLTYTCNHTQYCTNSRFLNLIVFCNNVASLFFHVISYHWCIIMILGSTLIRFESLMRNSWLMKFDWTCACAETDPHVRLHNTHTSRY